MLYGIPQILTTVIVGKIRFLFFHLKIYFQPVFDEKHLNDLIKSIHDLQKCKTPTSKPKINPK
jgi:hypothetical protein